LGDINLRRGKTNTGRPVHGFQHIRHELSQCVVKMRDGPRFFAKSGVGVMKYLKERHDCLSWPRAIKNMDWVSIHQAERRPTATA
jgi:hypothetical protein